MENYQIARQFSMLSKLMDIHAENAFKSKSYSIAAFNIEKLPVELNAVPRNELAGLKGIGDSLAKKIIEILDHGHLPLLEEYILKTPQGILEMMQVKGLGPKKIHTIWKEMEIETPGELLHACTENRLARFKGFGEKTQQSVEEAIRFIMKSKGSRLYAEIEAFTLDIQQKLTDAFPQQLFELTGSFRRKLPVIETLEWVSTASPDSIAGFLAAYGFEIQESGAEYITLNSAEKILVRFFCVRPELFYARLFETSCSPEFLQAFENLQKDAQDEYISEEAIFRKAGLHPIPTELREDPKVIEFARKQSFPEPMQVADIRGIIHSHSTWSDGSCSIEKMAKACIDRGLEYLVISDHSKSAFYANGLQEDRILQQHEEIDRLNQQLAPFRIFKSIESDILYDGSLDYPDNILQTFDLVIASVHSNLKMPVEKAMTRLLKAIEHPCTTILGHMTGRLLLSRPGYPVDHHAIIDACARHKVAIEINANPRRLDIDWEFLAYALEKGVMLSINPDAHDIDEFDYVQYGVYMARKGNVQPQHNLSSYTRSELEAFLNANSKKTALSAV